MMGKVLAIDDDDNDEDDNIQCLASKQSHAKYNKRTKVELNEVRKTMTQAQGDQKDQIERK